jgi:hypothetical protein
MDTVVSREINGLLQNNAGVVVAVEGVEGSVRVRSLTMGDFLDERVVADLAVIGKQIFSSIDQLASLLRGDLSSESLDQVVAILTPCLPAVRRVMGRCIDKPLCDVPLPLAPRIIGEFAKNFTGPRLQPWVGLMTGMRAGMAKIATSGTSATPARSSSTTDTPAGATTAPSSSSSGSGDASAVTPANPATSSRDNSPSSAAQ